MKVSVNENVVDECILELQKLIRIPSVKSEPDLNKPFGKEIDHALLSFLALADRLGFATRNLDGYIGIVEMGEGEEELGILVHVDVVPAIDLNQWKYPPFSGHIEDDRIWGRGTLDDKGPAMAVLYAMKILNSLDLAWNKKVKLIIGTDEESTWEDIAYFKKNEPIPTMAFTPDGYFPITHSEKGILTLGFDSIIKSSSIIEKFQAGDRFNSTPSEATAVISVNSYNLNRNALPEYISIHPITDSKLLIKACGISGHTSSPNQEQNPIYLLLKHIATFLPSEDGFWEVIYFFENYLEETNGVGLNCDLHDDISGELTIAQSVLEWEDGVVRFINNLRIPSSMSIEKIVSRCKSAILNTSFTTHVLERKDPIHLDINSSFFQDLMATYNEHFNTQAEPMSISGGTYARAFPNTVAFGALIPGKPLNAHQPNENVELEVIKDWITIYANAILRIASKGE